jgi:TatA/E family protein of Tat protein translocase
METKELLIILVVALVVFGAKKLRGVGEDLGHAVRGFKKAMNEGEQEEAAAAAPGGRIRADRAEVEVPQAPRVARADAASLRPDSAPAATTSRQA